MAQDSIGIFTIDVDDDSKERKSFSVFSPVITVGNIVNQNTLSTAYMNAVKDLILGAVNQFAQVTYRNTENPQLAATAGAMRELHWVIQYKDTVTNSFHTFRIPTPDNASANLRKPSKDYADTTDAAWVAFQTAFDAYARSPAGNAVVFVDAVMVGHNDRRAPLFS